MLTIERPTLTINRIGKHLGAEISGVDLSKPIDDETFARIAEAFFDNEVAFFRNQRITPAQQVEFTRRFGVLEQHVRKESRLTGFPEILVVSNVLDEHGNAIGSSRMCERHIIIADGPSWCGMPSWINPGYRPGERSPKCKAARMIAEVRSFRWNGRTFIRHLYPCLVGRYRSADFDVMIQRRISQKVHHF